jgi:hypothetical protein
MAERCAVLAPETATMQWKATLSGSQGEIAMQLETTRWLRPATLAFLLAFALLPAAAQPAASDDDQIREAVVRYQVAKSDVKAEVYFLAIDGKDPSEALLKRVGDLNPPVKRKSLSKKTKDAFGTIVEAKTEKIGVLFEQGAIRRTGETKADVAGGYLCGGLCSASGTYHLELREGRWMVTGFEVGSKS